MSPFYSSMPRRYTSVPSFAFRFSPFESLTPLSTAFTHIAPVSPFPAVFTHFNGGCTPFEEKINTTKPSSINEPVSPEPARCQHRTGRGRCRQLATDPSGTLCFDHARAAIQAKDDFAALPSLIRKPEDFQSAVDLNASLAALHNLLAEGRISPRRAAVIAYVDSLILRTLSAMEKEDAQAVIQTGRTEDGFPILPNGMIFDLPRPRRDLPPPAPPQTTSP